MIRKIAIAIVIVLVVVGALAGIKAAQIKKLMDMSKTFVQPPTSVSSFVAREEKWQGTLSAIGSVAAVQGVLVTPEIPGTIREIAFESGAMVEKGALLVKLDTSSEEAQLQALEAQLQLARINLERVQTLRKDNMVSQAELDAAESTLKQTKGNADAIRATIEKKTIRAPFAGKLGIRLVNLGQYIDTTKPIVSLQSMAQVYANFSLPQQELSKLKPGMKVRLSTDTYPGRQFEGILTALNPDLDQTTRSVGLQATLDNPEQLLRAGMFARIEVLLPEERPALVIPATAILSAPYGDSVYVIESKAGKDGKPEQTVRQQFVRTGQSRGDFVQVEAGLKAGERIVSAGVFKLRNGMAISENNELAPKSSETPKPSDS